MNDVIGGRIAEALEEILKEIRCEREERHTNSTRLELQLDELKTELSYIRQVIRDK